MLISRADFTYTIIDNVLRIIDEDKGNMSVTNDMRNVLTDIERIVGSLSGMRIIYRDSDSHWDEVFGWPVSIQFKPITDGLRVE